MANPLHQFEVQPIIPIHIGNVDASYTNSALFMTIAVVLITVFPLTSVKSRAIVPGRMQSLAELAYEFVANMLKQT